MSYQQLLSLLRTSQREMEESQEEQEQRPQACPNDGEPLRTAPDGGLYCPYDGWRPNC